VFWFAFFFCFSLFFSAFLCFSLLFLCFSYSFSYTFLILFLYFSLLFSAFLRVRNQRKEEEKQRKNKRKEKEKKRKRKGKAKEKRGKAEKSKRKENRRPSSRRVPRHFFVPRLEATTAIFPSSHQYTFKRLEILLDPWNIVPWRYQASSSSSPPWDVVPWWQSNNPNSHLEAKLEQVKRTLREHDRTRARHLGTAIYFPTTSHQLRQFLVLYSLFVHH